MSRVQNRATSARTSEKGQDERTDKTLKMIKCMDANTIMKCIKIVYKERNRG
jgi:hypothetical protein